VTLVKPLPSARCIVKTAINEHTKSKGRDNRHIDYDGSSIVLFRIHILHTFLSALLFVYLHQTLPMSYLILQDYKKLIQSDNLSQIIGADYSLVTQMQLAAQAEVVSYLRQKYLTSAEFTDTSLFNRTLTYYAKNRVYLDATAFSTTSTYALFSLTLYLGNVYSCTVAITVAGAWNPAKWQLLGAQYDILYVGLPNPEWDYYATYQVGDEVWYADKIYTCVVANLSVQPNEHTEFWGTGTTYLRTGSSLVSGDAAWIKADNRNQQMVNMMIDVTLFHLHSRIAPRNIPDLRVKRYDDVIAWLKNCSKGTDITADLPLIQPKSGQRIRYGSRLVKQNNNY
jgi:hypothetical protein